MYAQVKTLKKWKLPYKWLLQRISRLKSFNRRKVCQVRSHEAFAATEFNGSLSGRQPRHHVTFPDVSGANSRNVGKLSLLTRLSCPRDFQCVRVFTVLRNDRFFKVHKTLLCGSWLYKGPYLTESGTVLLVGSLLHWIMINRNNQWSNDTEFVKFVIPGYMHKILQNSTNCVVRTSRSKSNIQQQVN
jgi:hypothetical protein